MGKYWHGNRGNDSTPQSNIGEWDWDDNGAAYAASNWRDTDTGLGVQMPQDGEEVFLDNRAFFNVLLGTVGRYQDIINGDQTGDPDLALMNVAPSFDGLQGLVGTPIQIGVNNNGGGGGVFNFRGTGIGYYMLTQGATAHSQCDELFVNSEGGTLFIKAEVNTADYLSELVKIIVKNGYLRIATVADADTISIRNMELIAATANVIVGTSVKSVRTGDEFNMIVKQLDGILTSDSPFEEWEGYGEAVFNWGSAVATAKSDVDCTGFLKIYEDASIIVAPKNSGTANLLQFFAYGGTIDRSQALNAKVPLSIGSVSNEISEIHPGAIVKLNNGNSNVEFLGTSKIKILGGSLEAPFNKQIDW